MSIFYFIGMPGCGKTTLGFQFAKSRNLNFIDMDSEIEKKEGASISDVFKTKGEDYFRELERLVLHDCSKMNNVVISTGGGAPCFFDNTQHMLANGQVVFIDVSPKEIVHRMTVGNSQNNRPLLAGKKTCELEEELVKKRNQRLEFYNKANFRFTSDSLRINDLEGRL